MTASRMQYEPFLLDKDVRKVRESRIFWLLMGVWVVNFFDLGFTLLAYEQRMLVELNPLVNRLLGYGPVTIIVYKIALLGFGTAIIWWYRRLDISEQTAWIYAIICIGLALWWYIFYDNIGPIYAETGLSREILPDGTHIYFPKTPAS